MSAVYDSWERLVGAVLSREDLRRSGMRTPSEISSLSARSSFSLISPFDYSANSSSFTCDQILRATDSLSRSKLIFYGVSGDFYHGVLEEGGVPVVVKKVNSAQLSFLRSEMDFYAKVSHPKFVPLVGYCTENQDHKFVVYEYMANGNLYSSLYNNMGIAANGQSQPLDWKSRLKVATGVAQALCHLHHECVPPLVHRNVKASSILIDENYDGFLGRITEVSTEKKDRKQNIIFKLLRFPRGSGQGDSDPSNATSANDVYCFGMVLLQLVTGFPVLSDDNSSAPNSLENILPYISTYNRELFGIIMDPCLTRDGHLYNEIWEVAVVAKACLRPEPSQRPLMKNVLKTLENFELKEFSTYVGFPSNSEFTLVAQETGIPEVSEVAGTSQKTSNALFFHRWSALWESQYSPFSGTDEDYRNLKISDVPNLKIFEFAQLKAATENFSSGGLLGEGGFGTVYKGCLPESALDSDRQSLIAVKRWRPESFRGLEEWQTEIKMLGRLSHPNLIKLHGYCFEDKELVLVYEYMPNGSLHNHLFGRGSGIQPLSWDIRVKVLVGAARGLAYLHAFKREVIFRDFKTSSILLDSFYNPKLSDFGLAMIGPPENETHVSTLVMGTMGYAAPEYLATGHLYVKSDVYSFGAVVVEMLTGLRAFSYSRSEGPQNLVDWIRPRLSDKRKIKTIMDSRLEGKYSVKGAVRMAQLALTCLDEIPNNRPSMKQVLETLLGIESFLEK